LNVTDVSEKPGVSIVIVKMETAGSSETLITFYHTTRDHLKMEAAGNSETLVMFY
jgi:hypothetical protein